MIMLRVEDYCMECLDFEPKIERTEIRSPISGKVRCDTTLICKWRERCRTIKEHLEKEGNKEQDISLNTQREQRT